MWQLHNDVSLVVLPINYVDNSFVHINDTRQASPIHVSYNRTTLASSTCMFCSPRYWISLPVNLRESNELYDNFPTNF